MKIASDRSSTEKAAAATQETKISTVANGENATLKLARHAATLKYEALQTALVILIKQCVLDTLGVVIGASTLAPEGKIVADYVKDLGGKAESTILGFGGKAPTLSMANSAIPVRMGRAVQQQFSRLP